MSKSTQLHYKVESKDIPCGDYFIDESKSFFLGPSGFSILTSSIRSCETLTSANFSSHTNSGRLAGGVIGFGLAGPIGAVAGLMTGGKVNTDETIIKCTTENQKTFIATCNTSAHTEILKIISLSSNQSSAEKLPNIGLIHAAAEVDKSPKEAPLKDCPACGEKIRKNARICRHCNTTQKYVDGPQFGSGIEKFLRIFLTHEDYRDEFGLTSTGIVRLYYVLRAVDNYFSHKGENYTLSHMAYAAATDWCISRDEVSDEFDERRTVNPDTMFVSESDYYADHLWQYGCNIYGFIFSGNYFSPDDYDVGSVNDIDTEMSDFVRAALDEYKARFGG